MGAAWRGISSRRFGEYRYMLAQDDGDRAAEDVLRDRDLLRGRQASTAPCPLASRKDDEDEEE